MTTRYLIIFTAVAARRRRAGVAPPGLAGRRRPGAVRAVAARASSSSASRCGCSSRSALLAVGLAWHRFSRTSATVTRWGARTRRKSGVASTFDIARVGSGMAMRRKAATVRPSLTALDAAGAVVAAARAADRGGGVAAVPGRPAAGVDLRRGRARGVRRPADRQDPVPGRADHRRPRRRPGHLDPHRPLRGHRTACARERGPVYVFNAVGLAGLPSTITFDPLTGCADPVTAAERAADMLGATTPGAGRGWVGGAGVLGRPGPPRPRPRCCTPPPSAGCRCATCTAGCPTRTPGTPGSPRCCAARRSRRSRPTSPSSSSTNSRTRTSITSTIMPALGVARPPGRRGRRRSPARPGSTSPSCSPPGRRCTCSVGRRPRPRPLVCALTGHIARQARALAALQPGRPAGPRR